MVGEAQRILAVLGKEVSARLETITATEFEIYGSCRDACEKVTGLKQRCDLQGAQRWLSARWWLFLWYL